MPELSQLRQASLPLPRYNPRGAVGPVNFAPPVASTEAASTSAAFATLAEAIGNLPNAMMEAYQEGKRGRIQEDAQKQVADRLASGDLTDLTVETSDKGTSVSLNKPDPYGDIRALIAKQNLLDQQRGPALYNDIVSRSRPSGGGTPPAASPPLPKGPLADLPEPSEGFTPTKPGLGGMTEAPLPSANQDPMEVAARERGDLSGISETPVLDQNTGLIFTTDAAGRQISIDPTGKIEVVNKDGAKTKTGFEFGTIEEANAFAEKHGFNTPKVSQKDGKLVVDEFTPKDVDEKGKIKLTDSTRKELASAQNLMADLDGLEATQERLYSEDKAGPVAGRIEQLKAKMGFGDAGYVGAAGQIDVGQFKIARLLNGPGVLTDKDITRAQSVAPTLNETPASFKAKMANVRRMLKESVQTWLTINGTGATPDQKALAEGAIKALGGASEASKPVSGGLNNLATELDKRQALLDKGTKADGTPLTASERAAVQMLIDRERAKLR